MSRVVSADGLDNIAVFFDSSGKLTPFEMMETK